jgi:hypothetical protein
MGPINLASEAHQMNLAKLRTKRGALDQQASVLRS